MTDVVFVEQVQLMISSFPFEFTLESSVFQTGRNAFLGRHRLVNQMKIKTTIKLTLQVKGVTIVAKTAQFRYKEISPWFLIDKKI